MGVRGLKTFLNGEKQTRIVDIGDEVDKWVRSHPHQVPTIVIDFKNITEWVQRKADNICGGRPKRAMADWKNKLELLKSSGCSLVFFSDLRTEESRIGEKLRRGEMKFSRMTNLYQLIDDGKTLDEILAEKIDCPSLNDGLADIAKLFGEYHISVGHECDYEIIKYAKQQNVMAIISGDTDFLIFDESCKVWSTNDITVTASNRIRISEYKENAIQNAVKLTRSQLPLFATLLGNDFTRTYFEELRTFFGGWKHRFRNVAHYIETMEKRYWRKIDYAHLADYQITDISRDILERADADFERLIKQSLASYDINAVTVEAKDDPVEQALLNTAMYLRYMATLKPIRSFSLSYFDMRDFDSGETFMKLKVEWLTRRVGVVRQHNRDDSFRLTALMKTTKNEKYMAHELQPIYPDFRIPPLDRLYLETTDDIEMTEIRWKIFAWLMSFSNDEIYLLRQLPKEYQLICTTLHTLAKNGLITIDEADRILYTERMVYANKTLDAEYPTVLVTRYVRVAHTYVLIFKTIKENYEVAGLKAMIQCLCQFDGVYFQQRMENMLTGAEQEEIEDYRIYV